MEKKVKRCLLELGITPNYVGFKYLCLAVLIVMEDMEKVTRVTKSLYPEVAAAYGVRGATVERAIRTVVRECWNHGNRELMEQILCQKLIAPPENARFIGALSLYLTDRQDEIAFL